MNNASMLPFATHRISFHPKQTFVQNAANGGNEPIFTDAAERTNVGILQDALQTHEIVSSHDLQKVNDR